MLWRILFWVTFCFIPSHENCLEKKKKKKKMLFKFYFLSWRKHNHENYGILWKLVNFFFIWDSYLNYLIIYVQKRQNVLTFFTTKRLYQKIILKIFKHFY